MTKDQITQFFTLIFDEKTKGLTPEFWQDFKTPFMADPTLLIQITEISSKNYQSKTNVEKVISEKIGNDKDYAKMVENYLTEIETANKEEEIEKETEEKDITAVEAEEAQTKTK